MWAAKVKTHLAGRLELAVEEFQAVVKDVLIGGVQAGFDAVPNHIGSSGRTLQLQDLQSRQTWGAVSDSDPHTFIHNSAKAPIWNIKGKYFRFAGSADVLEYRYWWKNTSPVRVEDENGGGG